MEWYEELGYVDELDARIEDRSSYKQDPELWCDKEQF